MYIHCKRMLIAKSKKSSTFHLAASAMCRSVVPGPSEVGCMPVPFRNPRRHRQSSPVPTTPRHRPHVGPACGCIPTVEGQFDTSG